MNHDINEFFPVQQGKCKKKRMGRNREKKELFFQRTISGLSIFMEKEGLMSFCGYYPHFPKMKI